MAYYLVVITRQTRGVGHEAAARRQPGGRPRGLACVTWLYIAWSIVPVLLAVLFSFNNGRSRSELAGLLDPWWYTDERVGRQDETCSSRCATASCSRC